MFGILLEDLENEYLKGYNYAFPFNTVDAYFLLISWKWDPKQLARLPDYGVMDGVSFLHEVDTNARRGRGGRGGRNGRGGRGK